MRMVLVLVTVLTAALAAAPALAQTEGGQYEEAPPGGSAGAIARGPGDPPPDPPDYVLDEYGTVIVDGDTGSDCRTFAQAREDGYFRTGEQEQARSVLEQCERRGLLLSSGDQYAANTPARGQQTPFNRAELPATGGSSLSMLSAPPVSGVSLIFLAVLGIAARRRTS